MEEIFYLVKKEFDEWDIFFVRSKFWRIFRVIAWVLRFKYNLFIKKYKTKKRTGSLTIEELSYVRDRWIRKE